MEDSLGTKVPNNPAKHLKLSQDGTDISGEPPRKSWQFWVRLQSGECFLTIALITGFSN